jgi:hypothetical protein
VYGFQYKNQFLGLMHDVSSCPFDFVRSGLLPFVFLFVHCSGSISRARVWVAGIFLYFGVPVMRALPVRSLNRFACSCWSRSQSCTRSGPRPGGSHAPVSDFVSRLSPAAAPSSLALVLVDVSQSVAGDHILARPGFDSTATGLGSIFYANSRPVIRCLFSALRSHHSGQVKVFIFIFLLHFSFFFA